MSRCVGITPGAVGREVAHEQADQLLGARIQQAFVAGRGVYGSPRIHAFLRHQGIRCGRKRIVRLMRAQGLCARRVRRRKPRTTDSQHAYPVAPNLLERNFAATAPNRKWVADITDTLDAGGLALLVGHCGCLFAPGHWLCHGHAAG
jgi:putative transposase